MNEARRVLRKSQDDYVFRGTLGGLAEYFGWSSFKVRLAFVLLTLSTAAFPGLLLYIILTIVMPEPVPEDVFRLEDFRKQ